MKYTIKEVSEIIGISAYTLRYYDKEGLLANVERDKNGIRLFNEKNLQWIYLIQCLRKTNMPLKDIKHYISLAKLGDSSVKERLDIIEKQKQATLEKIEEMRKQAEILDQKMSYYESILSGENPKDIWNPEHNKPKDGLNKKISEHHVDVTLKKAGF